MATNPKRLQHEDGLTEEEYQEYQDIANKYDTGARKDTTLNMRISSRKLELIKKAAREKGFSKYQQWVEEILTQAVAETLKVL